MAGFFETIVPVLQHRNRCCIFCFFQVRLAQRIETSPDIHQFFITPGFKNRTHDHRAVATGTMNIVFFVSVQLCHILVDEVQRKIFCSQEMFRLKFAFASCVQQVDLFSFFFIQHCKIFGTYLIDGFPYQILPPSMISFPLLNIQQYYHTLPVTGESLLPLPFPHRQEIKLVV